MPPAKHEKPSPAVAETTNDALRQRHAPVVLVVGVLLAAGLSAHGLTNHLFWNDESNTALFARNLLHQGELTAWDNQNLVGFRLGAELDANLNNVYMPPLQYYLAAAGMWVFGEGTLGGRLPFLLCGLAALAFLALSTRRLFGERFPWYLPALLTGLSPAYLLYIRQCRYYALGALLTMVLLWTWASPRTCRAQLIRSSAIGALAIVLLILTNYLNAAAALACMLGALVARRYRRRSHLIFLGSILCAASIVGIWTALNANPFAAEVTRPDLLPAWRRFFVLASWHLTGLGSFEFFPVAALALLALPYLSSRAIRDRPLAEQGGLIACAMLLFTLTSCLLTPQTVAMTTVADMRYLVPLIPMGSMVTAVAVVVAWRCSRPLALVAVALIVCTNLPYLAFVGDRPISSTLLRYVRENHDDYETGTEAMVRLLREEPSGTIVQILPPHMSYGPMFYVPKLRYCCQLAADKELRSDLRARLPDYLFAERARPDLVLAAGTDPLALIEKLERPVGGKYRLERTLPILWEDRSRPEIPWHAFETPAIRADHLDQISVIRRTDRQ